MVKPGIRSLRSGPARATNAETAQIGYSVHSRARPAATFPDTVIASAAIAKHTKVRQSADHRLPMPSVGRESHEVYPLCAGGVGLCACRPPGECGNHHRETDR